MKLVDQSVIYSLSYTCVVQVGMLLRTPSDLSNAYRNAIKAWRILQDLLC